VILAERPPAVATRRRANLRRLLKPRHVAFVGGEGVAESIAQCAAAGFAGEIWAVNPRRAELAGRPCFRSVLDLPAAPDAAFIVVPREPTIEVVRQLAQRGAGGAVCYAAGYAELGPDGAALQRALVEAAGDLALVGPNCYGILNYIDGVAMWPVGHGGGRVERGVAVLAQSGNVALNLTSNERSMPFAYVVSVGNQAVLTLADFVEALADDPKVSAIGLYVEGLTDAPAFAAAAARALERGVPLVVLKAGNSPLGARLALSHTSSLAGDDRLYAALFERAGVVRVGSLTALLETLKLLSVSGPPPGDRLAVFTCSGGDGLLAADRAADLGLKLPEFVPAQAAALRAQLPAFATVSNPLDYNTSLWNDGPALVRCFSAVLEGDYDLGLLVIDYPRNDAAGRAACDVALDALIEAGRGTGKAVAVAGTLPELLPEAPRWRLIERGVAPLQGIDDALVAVAAAIAYGRRRREILAAGGARPLPPLSPAPVRPRLLDEWDSKRRLARFGLAIPDGRLVSAVAAPVAAAGLGFPVAVKVARPAIAHKTEAGAVALDLNSASDVAAAVAAMTEALAAARPGVEIERFLVERQITAAVAELIVGVRRDEQFGLALVVGAGGVLAEMFDDVATLLLPTDRAAVERAVGGLRIARLLAGYRGRPAGDIAAVVDAVLAVAAFAEAHRDRLVELDVNPLLVLREGAVAADALIVMDAD